MDNQYILGLDGGGTKTIARLVNIKTEQQWQEISGPASLTNDFSVALKNNQEMCHSLLRQANIKADKVVAVLGMAGAGDVKKVAEFTNLINIPFAKFEVCTDAKTSLFGANMGKPVAVVSLGTGSVGATLYPDGHNTQTGGWGFVAGDEGGGAKLGLLAIQLVLTELQKENEEHTPLADAISKRFGNLANIVTWSTTASPRDFAELAPLTFSLNGHCPLASQAISSHLQSVEALINNTRAKSNLPVVILGGLAKSTKVLLSPIVKALLIEQKGIALDGACLLARRLLANQQSICTHSSNGSYI
jgi:glucosamine kinase